LDFGRFFSEIGFGADPLGPVACFQTLSRSPTRQKEKGEKKDNMGWSGWEKSGNLTTYDTDR
jgi:hypothetical protein